jgi:hypothetical protein
MTVLPDDPHTPVTNSAPETVTVTEQNLEDPEGESLVTYSLSPRTVGKMCRCLPKSRR